MRLVNLLECVSYHSVPSESSFLHHISAQPTFLLGRGGLLPIFFCWFLDSEILKKLQSGTFTLSVDCIVLDHLVQNSA